MRKIAFLLLIASVSAGSANAVDLVFYDSFESFIGQNWLQWYDVSGDPQSCCGPNMLFNDNSHAHHGTQAARQEQAQPWWYGSVHDEYFLPEDKIIRLRVWQFEDANAEYLAPANPSDGRYQNHDQVQGWIALMDVYEEEFAGIGVAAHWASAPPLLARWQNVSYGTSSDGWTPTEFPRAQGWRLLEIWVKPYTGNVGDIQFFINGTKVGQGRRQPGPLGTGVPIERIGIGSSPAHVPEDYISNTYEFFWYDEVTLTVGITGDFDGDGDVDVADFLVFQACFNGPDQPPASQSGCAEANLDGDAAGDVDVADFLVFQACFNGPDNPPPIACP